MTFNRIHRHISGENHNFKGCCTLMFIAVAKIQKQSKLNVH